MANTEEARSVYRYFDLADCFVQILVAESDLLSLPKRPGLNRASYRRMVIQTCMPEFGDDVEGSLEALFPEDPFMVEDLLYQLCVEVNPSLDIHEVKLQVDTGHEAGEGPRLQAQDAGGEDVFARLRIRVAGLEGRLKAAVIGQDEAVEALVGGVKKAAVGLSAENKPLASFLFSGRTGTGKTELARSLAREFFGSADWNGLVRIDCSEFGLAHEYSKLIGSPPGYVGHDDGGQLTDALQKHRESVVLFDEIEKAHPRLHNLLLQILEEGALTDGKGRRVSFDRTIVILTSNAGAPEIQAATDGVGFGRSRTLGRDQLETITRSALADQFSPEFLGRIDESILFNELGPAPVERIARKKLFELALRARGRGLAVAFTPAVARWVAKKGYSPEYGARELRRVIQREVEPRLSDLVLGRGVTGDQLVRVRVRGDELVFEIED